MKKFFLIFTLLYSVHLFSQKRITGKVFDAQKKPLVGASVYLNNTSIGATTDDLGEFELSVREGTYDLVISFLGFHTVRYQLHTKDYTKPLYFSLLVKENVLDEVVISSKKKSTVDRKYHLWAFKDEFIGRTNLSKRCKIINDEELVFEYDPKTFILEAYSKKPLQIIHSGLGYKIIYDLVDFTLTKNHVTYVGYSRYEKLKGSKRKLKRWKKNRLKAYNGSRMHFIRSLRNENFWDEGFRIDQFKKVLNPNRPHDTIIKKARAYLRSLQGNIFQINFNKVIINPVTKKDSAINIVRKAGLKKLINVPIKKGLFSSDLIFQEGNTIKMGFEDFLKITYKYEKEEYSYRPLEKHRLDYQQSMMSLYTKDVILDPSGSIINPLDALLEGYWAYEKMADTLPLDYEPPKD